MEENDKEYRQYYKSRYGAPKNNPEPIPGWIILIPLGLALLLILLYHYSG